MKKILLIPLMLANFCNGEEAQPCTLPFPFSLSAEYLAVGEAKFRTPSVEGEHLVYHQATLALAYIHPFTSYCGMIFGSGYVGTKVAWKENPSFDEKHFSYVDFALGGYTTSLPDWFWSLTVTGFIDTEVLDLSDYALYQGVLWGKYNWCDAMTLHAGFILEIGLNQEKIWPILGFEWTPCSNWRLHAIYPVDISLEYDFFEDWTIGTSIQFLRNRHRVKETEPLPKGVFEYRTWGAEIDLSYTPFPWLMVEGFAGSTFYGELKIADWRNKHATHYKFKDAFYSGISAVLSY
jgi:hypothetical protein